MVSSLLHSSLNTLSNAAGLAVGVVRSSTDASLATLVLRAVVEPDDVEPDEMAGVGLALHRHGRGAVSANRPALSVCM